MNKNRLFMLLLSVVIIGLIAWGVLRVLNEEKGEPEEESAEKPPAKALRTPEGDPLVKIETAAQTLAGLRTDQLTPQTLQPEIVAYGRLEEDPANSFVLRAPMAGILHAGTAGAWPARGERIPAGATIGAIEARFAPAERISLASQLTMARSELNASAVAGASARAAFERASILNADNKNVSDRVLEEAEARLKEEEERLRAAKESVQLLEDSLRAAGPGGIIPLLAERGGDVVEVMAQPGESIEPGAPILRTTRLDRLLARVDVPAGERVPADVPSARIVPPGFEDQPLRATRAAMAPEADPQTQGQPFYFRLSETRFGLRPGHAVAAYLNLPGTPRRGVIIPRSALVRVDGKAYAYVKISEDQFVRKLVPLDDPVAGGYFTAVGFTAGDKIVTTGAQTLLSEELKSQIATEESR